MSTGARGPAPDEALRRRRHALFARGAKLHAVDDVSLHAAPRDDARDRGRVGQREEHGRAAARAAERRDAGAILLDGIDVDAVLAPRELRYRGRVQMIFRIRSHR